RRGVDHEPRASGGGAGPTGSSSAQKRLRREARGGRGRGCPYSRRAAWPLGSCGVLARRERLARNGNGQSEVWRGRAARFARGAERRKAPSSFGLPWGEVGSVRVVVTGATGNVGTSVLDALAMDPNVREIVGVARRLPA